jgi:hypothetical protein
MATCMSRHGEITPRTDRAWQYTAAIHDLSSWVSSLRPGDSCSIASSYCHYLCGLPGIEAILYRDPWLRDCQGGLSRGTKVLQTGFCRRVINIRSKCLLSISTGAANASRGPRFAPHCIRGRRCWRHRQQTKSSRCSGRAYSCG